MRSGRPTRWMILVICMVLAVPTSSARTTTRMQEPQAIPLIDGSLQRDLAQRKARRGLKGLKKISSSRSTSAKRKVEKKEKVDKGSKEKTKLVKAAPKTTKGNKASKTVVGSAPPPMTGGNTTPLTGSNLPPTSQPTCVECDDSSVSQELNSKSRVGPANRTTVGRLVVMGVVFALFVSIWLWIYWYVSIGRARRAEQNGDKVREPANADEWTVGESCGAAEETEEWVIEPTSSKKVEL
jgi:hypothetical protein